MSLFFFFFCLAEEVLSRGISNLGHKGSLSLKTGPRGTHMPSHVMYADDVMVFCRGSQKKLETLMELFHRYGETFGQIINPAKSTFNSGSVSANRQASIDEILGFQIGMLPFTYLGIHVFKGKPNTVHIQPIAERIKSKLDAWKVSLSSITGRVQLVKSAIVVCFM